tara:strand:- start:1915 stop:2499 length:585 start_codon:yes stop_codon:yes gene_type:complete
MSKAGIIKNLEEAQSVLNEFVAETSNMDKIAKAGDLFVESLSKKGKIISCGNGGSMSDAMHFAEELSGRFKENRKALAAVSISDPTHISCVANDFGYDFIFSRYVEALGNQGDVLLAISTSGNSKNVIHAAKAAHEKGMKVIGLTGKNGGDLAQICDIEIRAPFSQYADRAQEIHIKVIHSLIQYVEEQLDLSV